MKQRSATMADADQIAVLDEQCFPPSHRWSVQLWCEELVAEDRFVLVTTDDDDHLVAVATFQLSFEVIDLHRVMVSPPWRRFGIARALVIAGIHYAVSHGCERMLLEVRPDNSEAIAMYERFGFVQIDRRRDYYAVGVDALVMQRQLSTGQSLESSSLGQEVGS